MKIAALCDSWDMYASLRLAGIDSSQVSYEEFNKAFDKAINDEKTAVLLVSKAFCNLYEKQNMPLIMELV